MTRIMPLKSLYIFQDSVFNLQSLRLGVKCVKGYKWVLQSSDIKVILIVAMEKHHFLFAMCFISYLSPSSLLQVSQKRGKHQILDRVSIPSFETQIVIVTQQPATGTSNTDLTSSGEQRLLSSVKSVINHNKSLRDIFLCQGVDHDCSEIWLT